jgi:hypothetical protein
MTDYEPLNYGEQPVSDEEREYLNEMIRSLNSQLVDALRERDEARRDVCNMMHMTGFLAGDYADSKGWDCFKDGHTGFSPEIQNFRDIFYGYKDELRAERDEARREVCELKSLNFEGKITPKAYAQMRKWDCFEENSQ